MVATVILVISLGLGIAALWISSNTVETQVDQTLIQLAEEGAKHLDDIINIHLNSITEVAKLPKVQTMNWDIQYEALHEEIDKLNFDDMAVVTPSLL